MMELDVEYQDVRLPQEMNKLDVEYHAVWEGLNFKISLSNESLPTIVSYYGWEALV